MFPSALGHILEAEGLFRLRVTDLGLQESFLGNPSLPTF